MTTVIGSVPYLNARPLIRWFGTEEGRASGVSVIEDTPAKLALMLEAGEIDAALVSSFASFQHPEYRIISGVSISGQDEIKSVRAFSHIPFSMVHTVAMDTSSLTSVALLKILLAELYRSFPQALTHPPDLAQMLQRADAGLLIGDAGMLADGKGLRVLDLGEGWRRLTGLPFTYAVWLARPGKATPELAAALQHAKDWGLTQLDVIADEEAERLGCSREICYEYVSEVMDYNLDDEHHQALELFHTKCRSYALLSK